MYRNALIAATSLLFVASDPAHGQAYGVGAAGSPANPRTVLGGPGPTINDPSGTNDSEVRYRLSQAEVGQLARWGQVGRCVVAKDVEASRAYVTAKHGSPDARTAEDRLQPAFNACLTGMEINNKGNSGFRHAAVADALSMKSSAAR